MSYDGNLNDARRGESGGGCTEEGKLGHYYRTGMLSRLGTNFCPGFSPGISNPGQKIGVFSPGCGNRD